MLKVLIIGCGKIAGGKSKSINTHGGAYHANNSVDIVSCLDVDSVKAKNFAELYHCAEEKNIENALRNNRPDIVSICTPDNTHFEIAKILLIGSHRPKVIFIEKPVCQTVNELNELIALSEQYKIPVVVNHSRRFDQHHQQIKDRILDSEFGDLVAVMTSYYSGWKHNGVHAIDTLSYLFDDGIEINEIIKKIECRYPDDPTIELKASFKNSGAEIYLSSFDEKYYQIFEIDLRFTNARLRLEDFGERIILEKKYINNIGESVIKLVDNELTDKTATSMEQAINKIAQSVMQNNPILLEGVLLQDISQTMQTIWQGQKMAKMI